MGRRAGLVVLKYRKILSSHKVSNPIPSSQWNGRYTDHTTYGRLMDALVDWWVGWLVFVLAGCLVGWLVNGSIGFWFGYLVGQ